MKKALSVLLLIVLMLSVAACSSNKPADSIDIGSDRKSVV